MADPGTILGIFGGALQIISFTGELINLTRKIVETGSPDPALSTPSVALWGLSEQLEQSLSALDSAGVCTEEHKQLQKTAQQCVIAARAMADEVEKIDWTTDKTTSDSKRHRFLSRVRGKLGSKESEANASSNGDGANLASSTQRLKRHPLM